MINIIQKRLNTRLVSGSALSIRYGRQFSAAVHKKEDKPSPKLKIKSFTKSDQEVLNKEPAVLEDYTSAAEKNAKYVTKVGAAANLALAISKGTLGYAISSTGLIADAANSLGDLLSDAVVYYSVTESRKRATPDMPWGRGKIEPLGALSVGGLLLLTGVGIGATAVVAVMEAAAISNMMSPHLVELLQSGHYAQLVTDAVSSTVSGVAETVSNTSGTASSASSGAAGTPTLPAGEDPNSLDD
eukprot:gene30411-34329_t